MAISSTESKKQLEIPSKNNGSIKILVFYAIILGFYIISIFQHVWAFSAPVTDKKKYSAFLIIWDFTHYYFTGWNFMLQLTFLVMALLDESAKLTNRSTMQKWTRNRRTFIFSALVVPNTLVVCSFFWGFFHMDRELVFPKLIDDYYPKHLNHAFHTAILLPVIIETLVQFNNKNYRISRKQSIVVLIIYCAAYLSLYFNVYFSHGVWLYPVYGVLNWSQKILLTSLLCVLLCLLQQITISLLKMNKDTKIKIK